LGGDRCAMVRAIHVMLVHISFVLRMMEQARAADPIRSMAY
jgi:hypothetical protein